MPMVIANFRIDKRVWRRFLAKYPNASQRLRQLIMMDLGPESTSLIHRDNIMRLWELIYNDYDELPVQITGRVGVGKTTSIKRLIEYDSKHRYIVFDSHDEYDLKSVSQIGRYRENVRIKMPRQIAAAKGLFIVYYNQLLSEPLPKEYAVVIDEAHRYKPYIHTLLKEARKFFKLIAVSPEALADYTPVIEVRR